MAVPGARKVVQITATGVVENAMTQCEFVIHALCDDGTMWWRDNRGSGWVCIDDVPQDEVRWNQSTPPASLSEGR